MRATGRPSSDGSSIGRSSWIRFLAIGAVLVLALASCSNDEEPGATGDDTTTEQPADTGTEEPSGDATLAVASSDLGDILVDAEGFTLYVFFADTDGTSTCYDDCATTWPALTVEGDPVAGDGADDGLLGTTERDDGTTQVTYDDQPLYTYAPDEAPGDTNGQGVGDVWYVVGPDGKAIEDVGQAVTDDDGGAYDKY